MKRKTEKTELSYGADEILGKRSEKFEEGKEIYEVVYEYTGL